MYIVTIQENPRTLTVSDWLKQEDHDGPGVAHLFHTAPGNKGS